MCAEPTCIIYLHSLKVINSNWHWCKGLIGLSGRCHSNVPYDFLTLLDCFVSQRTQRNRNVFVWSHQCLASVCAVGFMAQKGVETKSYWHISQQKKNTTMSLWWTSVTEYSNSGQIILNCVIPKPWTQHNVRDRCTSPGNVPHCFKWKTVWIIKGVIPSKFHYALSIPV